MSWLKKHAGSARALAAVAVGGLVMTGCATNGYVDEQIAAVNSRIDATDARVTAATQRADAAQQTANQRLDQMGGRVDALERPPTRRPRG